MKRVLLAAAAAVPLGGSSLLLSATLFSLTAHAQQQQTEDEARSTEGATVRVDTVSRERAAVPRAAPTGVQSVRRRIQEIRGDGAPSAQRVIYPLIVVPSVSVSGASSPPPATSGGALRPFSGGSPGAQQQPSYYLPGRGGNARPRRRLFYDPSTGEIRIRRRGEEAGDNLVPLPDSVARRLPRSEDAPSQPGAASRETVRRIERAILETGLFRATNVNFEFDESTLLSAAENTLDAVGEVLARYPDLRIAVEGHTDAVGAAEYNEALSQRRAEAVARYLSENFDLEAGRLEPRGFGESRPVASNENATERTLNRRVTFRVLNPEAAEQYLETEETTVGPGSGAASSERDSTLRDSTTQQPDSTLREIIRERVRDALREEREGETPADAEDDGR